MKERPILFNGDMVRAILDGRKTQTRLPVKHHNISVHLQSVGNLAMSWCDFPGEPHTVTFDDIGYACPYGAVGDRLWVRETFNWSADNELAPYENHKHCPERKNYSAQNVVWKADGQEWNPLHPEWGITKWLPSIHMPRWASRITLEITGIRVERVQEISGKDCYKEGIVSQNEEFLAYEGAPATSMEELATYQIKLKYAESWNSIYLKRGYSWESNPWVWAIEFVQVKEQK